MHIRGRKLAFVAALFAAVFLLSATPARAWSWSTWYNPATWFTATASGTINGQVTVDGALSNQISIYADNTYVPNNGGSYSYTTNSVNRNVPLQFFFMNYNQTLCPGQLRTVNTTEYLRSGGTPTHDQNFKTTNCGSGSGGSGGSGGGGSTGGSGGGSGTTGPATISGKLTSGTAGVSGQTVTVVGAKTTSGRIANAITATDGSYSIANLAAAAAGTSVYVTFNCPAKVVNTSNFTIKPAQSYPNVNQSCGASSGGGGSGGGGTPAPTPAQGYVWGYVYQVVGNAYVPLKNASNVVSVNVGGSYPLNTDANGKYQQNSTATWSVGETDDVRCAYNNQKSTFSPVRRTAAVQRIDCKIGVLTPIVTPDQVTLKGVVRVSDANKYPAVGANVMVQQGSNAIYSAVTKDDGSYSITNPALKPGNYNLSVTLSGVAQTFIDNNNSDPSKQLHAGPNTRDISLIPLSPNILRGNITLPEKYKQISLKIMISSVDTATNTKTTLAEIVPNFGTGTSRSYNYQSEKLTAGTYIVEACRDRMSETSERTITCKSLGNSRTVIYLNDRGESKQIDFDLTQITVDCCLNTPIVRVTESSPYDDVRRPLAGVKVTMVISGETITGVTDQNGVYNIPRTYGFVREFSDIITSVNAQKTGYEMISHNEHSSFYLSEILMASNAGKGSNESIEDFYMRTTCEKEQVGTVLFWFCGTEAKQAHKDHADYWRGIATIVKGLQDRFGRLDNPPEIVITGGARWRNPFYQPVIPDRPAQSGCFPVPKHSVPFADSYIVLPMNIHKMYNWNLNSIRPIVVHEWGHGFDNANHGCSGMASINSPEFTDDFNRGTSFNDPKFFDTINENSYYSAGGGHPQQNVAEFDASVFTSYVLYPTQVAAAISKVPKEWQDIYSRVSKFVLKGR